MVAADGVNSQIRARLADSVEPDLDARANKYMWLGTDLVFEAFQFFVKSTPWGVMQIHAYPYSDSRSTFIVEMHEDVWRRAGFDATEELVFAPGESDEQAVARIAEIFAEELGEHRLLTNNSRWLSFTTVRNARWSVDNVVLVGDAAHTAHFSIGSGTKLAMEDALALAASPARAARRAECAGGVRGGAPAGCGVHPARGPGVAGVVREHRAVRRAGADPVLLQPPDPRRAGSPSRTSATATRDSPRRWCASSPIRRCTGPVRRLRRTLRRHRRCSSPCGWGS